MSASDQGCVLAAALRERYGVLMSALVADLLILAPIVYDMRTRGRPHAVYVIGGAILLVVQVLRGPLSTTQWWYALADSLARLAG
jgi:hypothetical protein